MGLDRFSDYHHVWTDMLLRCTSRCDATVFFIIPSDSMDFSCAVILGNGGTTWYME